MIGKRFLTWALPAVAAVSMVLPAAAGASISAPAGPAHSVAAADTPDGYPDPVTIEPDAPTVAPYCLSSDANICARDANNSDNTGNPIVNGHFVIGQATQSDFAPNGNSFTFNGHTYHTGLLHWANHPGLCYGMVSLTTFKMVTQACNGGTGIIWGHGSSNGHDVFINRFATQSANVLAVMASDDVDNDQMFVGNWFVSGIYKRWGQ